jgi:hypothetical protein
VKLQVLKKSRDVIWLAGITPELAELITLFFKDSVTRTKQVSLRLKPFRESMASTRRVVGWTGVDVDTSPTHYAEVASDCLWRPAVGADE